MINEIIDTTAKKILRRIDLFSTIVLGIPLRRYQIDPLQAVIDSIINHHGREYLLIFPRQSGKNEAVAHLLVYLLNLFQRSGGNIVYGAIGDGIGRGIQRLEERLTNPWNTTKWKRHAKPNRRTLGRAAVVFASSHPLAAARGETAHHLLVIDELQEQDAAHIDTVFTPMRAAANATALYLGTVRFTHDALWQKKKELEALQAADGHQRVWFVQPEYVCAENPPYKTFLDAQVARYGRNHPIVASEYYLEPIDASGGLFDARRQQLMQGSHDRQTEPFKFSTYIATIDVGGSDEQTAASGKLDNPRRDYTVVTISECSADRMTIYRAVDIMIDQGSKHFTQPQDGRLNLAEQILAYLQHWHVAAVIIDSSGLGLGLADWLDSHHHNVHKFLFTAHAKAQLASTFIALIEQGRAKYWRPITQFDDSWWFTQQAAACAYYIRPDGRFEHDLKWSVPDSHTTNTPSGFVPTHDDRLVSFALIAEAERLRLSGQLHLGTAESKITYRDPLEL